MPAARARKAKQGSQSGSGSSRRIIASAAALAILAVLAGYLLISTFGEEEAGAAPVDPGPPPIVFEPAAIDFGEMPANITRSETVQVVNTGASPLRIIAARSSCACMRTEMSAVLIQPGASAPLKLHMDSQDQPGPRTVTANVVVAGYEAPATLSVQRTTVVE